MSLSDLTNRVFNEDLLREMILEYAIEGRYCLSKPDLKSCRLVKKSWLDTISRLLRKSRKPLFRLYLHQTNSLNSSSDVQKNGKLLEQFVSAVSGPSRIEDRIPPFSIRARPDFFRKENYKSFSDCLEKCGSGLVELHITLPRDGGSMTFIFPTLNLPILKKITVNFVKESLRDARGEVTFGNNYHTIYFLQAIFNGCQELRELTVDTPYAAMLNLVPLGFEHLKLPPSITHLHFSFKVENNHLEVIGNNHLPNLKSVILHTPKIPLPDGVMHSVLKNISETLESLDLRDTSIFTGRPSDPTFIKFPKMEKLKCLHISSMNYELEGNPCNLQEKLPVMTTAHLSNQTVTMFDKWSERSKFESIKDLTVELVDKNFSVLGRNFIVNMNRSIMEGLHRAFPNVTKLEVTFSGMELDGLQYIFREMKQLEVLRVGVARADEMEGSDLWDSMLIGIPIQWASALNGAPGLWDCLQLQNEASPSIKNLTELRELELMTKEVGRRRSLISDAVFHFAFLKMEKLKKLILQGRFLVSFEMLQKWEDEGRDMEADIGKDDDDEDDSNSDDYFGDSD